KLLTYESAASSLSQLTEVSCFKPVLEYYLAKRFNRPNAASLFQGSKQCFEKLNEEALLNEISVYPLIETLYGNKEYGELTKFVQKNEQWLFRAYPFGAVLYVDSLGKSHSYREAQVEAKRLCTFSP